MHADTPEFDRQRALGLARETLNIEAQAVLGLAQRLDGSFGDALALLLACRGRVVVSGRASFSA